jgi:quercetin dioxygenase-like cupin family protein
LGLGSGQDAVETSPRKDLRAERILMLARPNEEIRIGGMAIRFRLEGEASGGSVAVFEFDVAAGARVPGAHSHDGYEETIYGLEGSKAC